jgi:hypothetical protein
MKIPWFFLFIACLPLGGQTDSSFDLPGLVQFVDPPPDAATVDQVIFHLSPIGGGIDVEARPNKNGSFTINGVRPGRYSLTYGMPGRIQTFAVGSRELAPENFELRSTDVGPLRLIITMVEAVVVVNVRSLPGGHAEVVALMVPADNHLTLRESCTYNRVIGTQAIFRYVPPGKYRILVVDANLSQDVAAFAPRSMDFLKNEATPVEAPHGGQIEVTATYVDRETVKAAIRQARGVPTNSR